MVSKSTETVHKLQRKGTQKRILDVLPCQPHCCIGARYHRYTYRLGTDSLRSLYTCSVYPVTRSMRKTSSRYRQKRLVASCLLDSYHRRDMDSRSFMQGRSVRSEPVGCKSENRPVNPQAAQEYNADMHKKTKCGRKVC